MKFVSQCKQSWRPSLIGTLFRSSLASSSVVLGVLSLLGCGTDTQAPVSGDTSSQADQQIVRVPPMRSGYMPSEYTYNCGPNRKESVSSIAHTTLPRNSIQPVLMQEFQVEGEPLQIDKQICYRIHTQDRALHRVTGTKCETVTFRDLGQEDNSLESNLLYGSLRDLNGFVAPIGEDILGVEFDPTEWVTFHQGHFDSRVARGSSCYGPQEKLTVDSEALQITINFSKEECREGEWPSTQVSIDNAPGRQTMNMKWESLGLVAGEEVARAETVVITSRRGYDATLYRGMFCYDKGCPSREEVPMYFDETHSVSLTFLDASPAEVMQISSALYVRDACSFP
jgi:hypothetical protein